MNIDGLEINLGLPAAIFYHYIFLMLDNIQERNIF